MDIEIKLKLDGKALGVESKMSQEQRRIFAARYRIRRRPMWLMVVLSIFCPIQHFFLGRPGLGIAYWLTAFWFGIGYVVEVFLTPKRVRLYNAIQRRNILRDMLGEIEEDDEEDWDDQEDWDEDEE